MKEYYLVAFCAIVRLNKGIPMTVEQSSDDKRYQNNNKGYNGKRQR